MSKKDKKAKKKHSANGSKDQDQGEVQLIATKQDAASDVPVEQQLPIDKKTYKKELARLQYDTLRQNAGHAHLF